MARATWVLAQGRPVIEIAIVPPHRGNRPIRTLLADTGAGSATAPMELILSEADCRRFALGVEGSIRLGAALSGWFTTYWLNVSIAALQFESPCLVVAVPSSHLPPGLQGIACFRFLNRFTYGNFGDFRRFGLEEP